MSAWIAVFRMRARMELQYRAAALGGLVTQVFFGLTLIALYRALFASGRAQTMSVQAVAAYVWFQQAFFRMLLSSDGEVGEKIRSGAFAYDLCRPLDLYGYYYVRALAFKSVGSLMRAVPMILITSFLPSGWGFPAPASAAGLMLAILSMVLGLICVCAVENIAVAFTVRTLDPKGIQACLNMAATLCSGNLLPLTLFPDSWQAVIRYLPYSQILDLPARVYTGQYAVREALALLPVQALWCVILIGVGILFWHGNEKRMTLQGG